MSVREFELFHGAVLAKIVRNDKPVTLRMIETKPNTEWAIYRINDEVELLVKHSKKPRPLKPPSRGRSWTFVFSGDQLSRVRSGSTWVALVCGDQTVDARGQEICLVEPAELRHLVPAGAQREQQSITVRLEQNRSLRVTGGGVEKVVARNRLETWAIPGS